MSASPVAEATVKALKTGHNLGKLVSFDVNYRNLMWKDDQQACADAVKAILPYVDILKISEEEVEMLGGQENIQNLMKENQITMVVETLGSEGALAYLGENVIQVAGRKVKAVDATGAGDAFWGHFYPLFEFRSGEKYRSYT